VLDPLTLARRAQTAHPCLSQGIHRNRRAEFSRHVAVIYPQPAIRARIAKVPTTSTRESANLKAAPHIAALVSLLAFSIAGVPTGAQDPRPAYPDGIFTPTITPVASIDKTRRPMTVEVRQPEPRLAQSMIAENPTGDSYFIHFSTTEAGGPCSYSGTGRYLISTGGTLTFQILADCGKLRRGYSYMICNLDPNLRCNEAPWWYFRDRTYAVTSEGVAVNGSAVYPWSDVSEPPQELKKIADGIQAMHDRFNNPADPHVMHGRFISCRDFHPETKSYAIHEFSITCLIKSLCNAMPNVDPLRDGDPIDWNSPAGTYVKQQSKTSDFSNWVCWMRTQ
jgi:hypothetical protein